MWSGKANLNVFIVNFEVYWNFMSFLNAPKRILEYFYISPDVFHAMFCLTRFLPEPFDLPFSKNTIHGVKGGS